MCIMKGQFRHFNKQWYFLPEDKLSSFDAEAELVYSTYTSNDFWAMTEALEKEYSLYTVVNPIFYTVDIEDLSNHYN